MNNWLLVGASYFFYLLLTVEIVVHTIVADVEDAMVVEERVVAAVLTNVTMGVPMSWRLFL